MAEERLTMHLCHRGIRMYKVPMSTTLEETDNEVLKLCVQKLVEKAVLAKLSCRDCQLMLWCVDDHGLGSMVKLMVEGGSDATILYDAYEYEVRRVFVSTNPLACRLLGDPEQVLDPYDPELTFDRWVQEDL